MATAGANPFSRTLRGAPSVTVSWPSGQAREAASGSVLAAALEPVEDLCEPQFGLADAALGLLASALGPLLDAQLALLGAVDRGDPLDGCGGGP